MERESVARKKDVFDGTPPGTKERTKKMTMYLIMFSVVMLFGGLTSAYIVKMAGGFWVHIQPNTMMYISLAFLIVSSLTMWYANRSLNQGKTSISSIMLLLTFLLGLGFTVTQVKGWKQLSAKGMGFTVDQTEDGFQKYRWNNFSEINAEYNKDYYFHINGDKAVLVDGDFFLESDTTLKEPVTNKINKQTNNASAFIVVLIVLHIIHLTFGLLYIIVNFIRIKTGEIHPEDSIRLKVNGIYWHFMGILWLYLFVFLFIFH